MAQNVAQAVVILPNVGPSLDVSQHMLTVVPPQILHLRNLTQLILNSNRLSDFPYELASLPSLAVLGLAWNQITHVDERLTSFKSSLCSLDLAFNGLTVLPQGLGELTSLHTLNLHDNKLQAIPDSIGQLSKLRYLHVDFNQLTGLPVSLKRLIGPPGCLVSLQFQGNTLADPKLAALTYCSLNEVKLYLVQCFAIA